VSLTALLSVLPLKDAMELRCHFIMSDLKVKCLCFYVLPETLEKWMETQEMITKCNVVTPEPNCLPLSGNVLLP
jgi:hypothetical protein